MPITFDFTGADFSGGSLPPSGDYGLLFADGVEPVSSTLFPLASGKRIWYVDAATPDGGDGSEGSPFNSFESVAGSWDGSNYTQGGAGLVGGDQIWVTGNFTASNHINGTKNMNIDLRRAAQFGTAAEPTVIRSWKGRPRAKFDGEYTDRIGIYAGLTSGATAGIVVLNVEVTRCTEPGVYMDDYLAHVRVVSCYTHFNYALSGGPLESYGGIRVRCSRGGQDVEVYNNKTTRNNTSNGVDYQLTGNNIGGISLLCQNLASSTSTVKFYNNDCYDETYLIRHKHSGACSVESYNNKLDTGVVAQYVRASGTNNIHDNIVSNVGIDVELEAENQTQRRTLIYTDNDLTEVDKVISTGPTTEVHGNDVTWSGTSYTNSSYTGPVIVMGQYGSSGSDLADVTGSSNVIAKAGTDFATNNGAVVNLASYASTTGDTTTTQVAP